MYKFSLFIFILFVATSCISIQEASNVVELSQAHNRIAILPIQATIERKIWMNQEKYTELNRIKSEQTQQRLYRQLEFYSRSGSVHAEIMSPDEVNALLHGAGYPNTVLNNNALCSLLKVDALLYGNIQVLEPMNEATAMMLNANNPNFNAITNIVQLNLMLYDAKSGQQIWASEQVDRGQMGSIKENMQRQVCRSAIRNLPHTLKKRRYKKAYSQF
ncbi:MAG: hypothetical protein RIS63_516 [Bacteroidota bacterium]|jgi:hypothetical protein